MRCNAQQVRTLGDQLVRGLMLDAAIGSSVFGAFVSPLVTYTLAQGNLKLDLFKAATYFTSYLMTRAAAQIFSGGSSCVTPVSFVLVRRLVSTSQYDSPKYLSVQGDRRGGCCWGGISNWGA